jgi:hypothetical protein
MSDATYPEHVLDAHSRVVHASPRRREFVAVRVFVVSAGRVDGDLSQTGAARAAQGPSRLARVALIDHEVDVTRLTSGQVRLQLGQSVLLGFVRLVATTQQTCTTMRSTMGLAVTISRTS